MPKLKKIQKEKTDGNRMVDLESFIQKKKIQNSALKKIIEKLNTSVENKVDN